MMAETQTRLVRKINDSTADYRIALEHLSLWIGANGIAYEIQ